MAHISRKRSAALLIIAGFFDLLSLVPGLSEIVSIIGQIVMGCLFFTQGVNVFQGRQATLYIVSTLVEAIPATSFAPMFLIETLVLISWSKRR
ncbi:MAG TPA: hypothetical protein VHE10_03220 [Candidatus Paceibacterota bacterium]|nr:hypothetical protein [Candidatus Paceibacterota bacterium]